MIRYIAGFITMNSGREITVTDQTTPTAELHIDAYSAVLRIEEMRYLAQCLKHAADRAETRIPAETPEDEQEDA